MPVEQHVADGTPADRGDEAEHHDADQVQPLASRRERTADGEHGDAEKVENVEKHWRWMLGGIVRADRIVQQRRPDYAGRRRSTNVSCCGAGVRRPTQSPVPASYVKDPPSSVSL